MTGQIECRHCRDDDRFAEGMSLSEGVLVPLPALFAAALAAMGLASAIGTLIGLA